MFSTDKIYEKVELNMATVGYYDCSKILEGAWSIYVPENLPKIRTRKNTLMSWAMANAWIWLSPRPFHSSVVFLFKWEKEVKKVKQEKNYQPSLSGNLNCTLTPVTSIIPFQKFA